MHLFNGEANRHLDLFGKDGEEKLKAMHSNFHFVQSAPTE